MAFDYLRNNSFKKGVTLTELLVAMAIASGVSLGLVSIYMAHYRIFTNQNALVEADTQNKLAMDQILKYMHEGAFFSTYALGACSPAGGATKTLAIALLPLDTSGNPYESGDNDHILFYRDPADTTKLVRKGYTRTTTTRVEAQNDPIPCPNWDDSKVVATGVTGFNITYDAADFLDASLATITLTTQSKTIYGKTFTSTQTFNAYLKND